MPASPWALGIQVLVLKLLLNSNEFAVLTISQRNTSHNAGKAACNCESTKLVQQQEFTLLIINYGLAPFNRPDLYVPLIKQHGNSVQVGTL